MGTAQRAHRISRACFRCRDRKIKCDGQEPICSTCNSSSQTCNYPETRKKRSVNRNIVRLKQVEEQLAAAHKLIVDIAQNGLDTRTTSALNAYVDSPDDRHMSDSMDSSDYSDNEPSTITLKDGIQTHKGRGALGSLPLEMPPGVSASHSTFASFGMRTDDVDSVISRSRKVGYVALPPRSAADSYVQAFFKHYDPLWPFLEKESFNMSVDGLYQGKVESPYSALCFAVFALGCAVVENRRYETLDSSLSWQYFAVAMVEMDDLIKRACFVSLQCLLAIVLYLQSVDKTSYCWFLSGILGRICVCMGIQKRVVQTEHSRRVFWCVFNMEE